MLATAAFIFADLLHLIVVLYILRGVVWTTLARLFCQHCECLYILAFSGKQKIQTTVSRICKMFLRFCFAVRGNRKKAGFTSENCGNSKYKNNRCQGSAKSCFFGECFRRQKEQTTYFKGERNLCYVACQNKKIQISFQRSMKFSFARPTLAVKWPPPNLLGHVVARN